ncbi:unnamed protein product, partial [marine sediment metagenome]
MEQKKKKGLLDFQRIKKEGEKVAWLTCYDFPMAQFEEQAGIDMILVGDSMGMCVYGYDAGTMPVTMDQCIVHTEAGEYHLAHTKKAGSLQYIHRPNNIHLKRCPGICIG